MSQGDNRGLFSAARLPSDSPNFKKFFGRVTVLRGSVLHGYNEGLFSAARLPSDLPNF